jgi:hypothetical protein
VKAIYSITEVSQARFFFIARSLFLSIRKLAAPQSWVDICPRRGCLS